jgi:hypothetical protein
MAISTTIGTPTSISTILEDGNEAQYPRAEIYAAGSPTPTETLDLPHTARGRYEADWTPSSVGIYSVVFIVYSDAAHTIENLDYTREMDQIFVSQVGTDDLAEQLVRVLGLVHENAFIDDTTYDAFGQLIAARVRLFDSKAHVELATDGGTETTGLIATYQIETTYESGYRMGTYRMKRAT